MPVCCCAKFVDAYGRIIKPKQNKIVLPPTKLIHIKENPIKLNPIINFYNDLEGANKPIILEEDLKTYFKSRRTPMLPYYNTDYKNINKDKSFKLENRYNHGITDYRQNGFHLTKTDPIIKNETNKKSRINANINLKPGQHIPYNYRTRFLEVTKTKPNLYKYGPAEILSLKELREHKSREKMKCKNEALARKNARIERQKLKELLDAEKEKVLTKKRNSAFRNTFMI